MEILSTLVSYLVPFIAVLTVLVFVHEMGHYMAARQCGVRVEVFSIGFGPEIYGRSDRHGTRWKLSAIPFGGYVKMFGERAPALTPGHSAPSAADIAVSFYAKPLRHRAWIVFAGPLANFLFAILVLAGMFTFIGQSFTPPDVGAVVPGSAAERAGIKPGDVFVRIDGTDIERFEQVRQLVQGAAGHKLRIVVRRDGREIDLTAIPDSVEETWYGRVQHIGRLGVTRTTRDMILKRYDPLTALWHATARTWSLSGSILDALGQIVAGERSAKELGGPIKIAEISGEMAQAGLIMVIQFAAILSINLGLINLFPIPLLDGGHLAFFFVEAVRGRPLGEKAMGYSLNFGLALIVCLTLFVTWNDLAQSRFVEYLLRLIA